MGYKPGKNWIEAKLNEEPQIPVTEKQVVETILKQDGKTRKSEQPIDSIKDLTYE